MTQLADVVSRQVFMRDHPRIEAQDPGILGVPEITSTTYCRRQL